MSSEQAMRRRERRRERRRNCVISITSDRGISVREVLTPAKLAARSKEAKESREREMASWTPERREFLRRLQNDDKEAWDALFAQNKRQQSALAREERLKATGEHWDRQLDRLADAYIVYTNRLLAETEPFPASAISKDSTYFDATAWSTSECRNRKFLYDLENNESANAALLRFGFIGSAPLFPSIAFHIQIFLAFEEKERAGDSTGRPSLCTEARILCKRFEIPYKQTLGKQLSVAYEVYLKILRHSKEKQTLLHSSSPSSSANPNSPPLNLDQSTVDPQFEDRRPHNQSAD